MVPAQLAAELDARSLSESAFQCFLHTNSTPPLPAGPPAVWNFELLTVAAMYFHPSLEVARADWAVAQGGDRTAAARLNPTVSAIPGYNFSAANGASPWIPALSFDLPIELAGKRAYRREQARQLTEAARLNIATTAWQVRAGLRGALLDFVAAHGREGRLRGQLALQERIVRSVEQRLQAGAVARTDLATAQLARDKTRLDWLESQRLGREARARVAEAIGLPVAALKDIEISAELPTPTAADGITAAAAREQALIGRADVLAALANYQASQAALQLEIAKQYPDLHLGPGYQFDQGDHKFTFGLTAELPLLNQNQGPIAEARARREAAAARFKALQARVLAELDHARTAQEAAAAQLAALEAVAASQQKQSEAVLGQIQAGAADPLDRVTAELEAGVTELARWDGQVRLQQARGALEDALQRPLASLAPVRIESPPPALQSKEQKP